MTKWYTKQIAKLADVSVQTLHHYDRIGLLKPSVRMENGYRVYSEEDLLKLQQIVALKALGFELAQIKVILAERASIRESLMTQARLLEEKAQSLHIASQTIDSVVNNLEGSEQIPPATIVKLLEVYNMTKQLEKSWVSEIFTPEEMKQYAEFEAEFKGNSTPEQKAAFEKNWADLVEQITNNLDRDPKSDIGVELGEKCMQWVNSVYGKKYAHLRTKKFEQGFGEGKGLDEIGMTPEVLVWMDKAMDAYWRKRIYGILDKVGSTPDPEVRALWDEVMDDMYGNEKPRKARLVEIALKEDRISEAAKKWLKDNYC